MPRKKKSEVEAKPAEKINMKDFKLEDLDDIGPIKAKRLRTAGVTSPFDFVVRGSQELSSIMGIKNEEAAVILGNVYAQLVEQGFVPDLSNVADLMKFRSKRVYFESGSKKLDELLDGGFESQAMWQLYGPEGAGKTQTIDTVVVLALSKGEPVVVIDAEGTFDMKRVMQIAKYRGFIELKDPKNPSEEDIKFFDKLTYKLALDTDRIGYEIDRLVPLVVEKDIKLVIVDGIVGKFRLEYSGGMGELSQRQNDIKPIMKHLQNMAEFLNICVILTNQVTSKPGFISVDNEPIGGHVFGHNFKYILRILKKSSPVNLRVVRLVKSNRDAQSDLEIFVNNEGLSDFQILPEKKEVKELLAEIQPTESAMIDKSLLNDGV